jgi:undecaprenyl-diphosphatase
LASARPRAKHRILHRGTLNSAAPPWHFATIAILTYVNTLKTIKTSLVLVWPGTCETVGSFARPWMPSLMTNLDTAVSHAFASLNGISPGFDAFVLMLTSNALLKGGVMVALLWFAWFSGERRACRVRSNRNRLVILSILLSCMAAELLSRILSNSLPFRPRPLLETSLPFRLPAGVTLESLGLSTQSSFPSDHGVLFFALAAGICLVCRRAGLFAFAWASIVIALPRLYVGLHYLSDLVVGALIGITIALVGAWLLPRTRLVKTAVLQARTHPACFYPVFFLAMFQLATMLADLRSLMVLVR